MKYEAMKSSACLSCYKDHLDALADQNSATWIELTDLLEGYREIESVEQIDEITYIYTVRLNDDVLCDYCNYADEEMK